MTFNDNARPRALPNNPGAEKALLGAILFDNENHKLVSEFLKGEHFHDKAHGRIFDACRTLIERGDTADATSLDPFFGDDPALQERGGVGYLSELVLASPETGVETYGRQIFDLHQRRELARAAQEALEAALAPDVEVSAQDCLERTQRALADIAAASGSNKGFTSFGAGMAQVVEEAEIATRRDTPIVGFSTGLIDLDRKLGGFQPSDLIIIAGRPSMGKSALAAGCAFHSSKLHISSGGREGAPNAFFSMEMSSDQIIGRLLAKEAGIPSDRIRRGDLQPTDFVTFADVANRLAEAPFFVDDSPGLTLQAVRTRILRLADELKAVGPIHIDYLQLMSGRGKAGENRTQELSEITRGLKGLAKELNVPVIGLSQLSRAVEQREDKRPMLSDLRESGSIEQDADIVMFVFREQYYLERAEPSRREKESAEAFNDRYSEWQERCREEHGRADIIIAKNRHGEIGPVKVGFEGRFTHFHDLDDRM